MSQLDISNVITVSVAQAPAGLIPFNTSNLALFTRDAYDTDTFTGTYKAYRSPTEVGTDFGTSSTTYQMAVAVFSQTPNILAGGGQLIVIPFLPGNEELGAAVTRMASVIQFFGVMQAEIDSQAYTLTAAQTIQALNKIGFFGSADILDFAPAGTFDLFRTTGYTKSRGLAYVGDGSNDSAAKLNALLMQAAYAGRALSVDFNGSNTTLTMNLKDLIGVDGDDGMTQTYQDQCIASGTDTYPSIQGVAKVLSQGANDFYDDVYNLGWFVGAIQVAGFNFLAQSATKVPQTEAGMTAFKGAFRRVCEQGVTNQYIAPGTWTLPDTFGNQEDFLLNILQRGYYIYSQPVGLQLPAVREQRIAPTVQIAVKEAGAIHSANILIEVNL